MYRSVEDLNKFYSSEIGVVVQKIIARHIHGFWPDARDFSVLGCGYALPYLDVFCETSERVISAMPAQQGVEYWPHNKKNLAFLTEDDRFPIENASIDRVILVHHLECCDNLQRSLREIWRVLKANGRVLIVVPNRMGVWARADWSPFGHGNPFTMTQLITCLNESLFSHEAHEGALFVPPLPDSPVMMKSANLIERMGQSVFPFVAGVHIVEVSKRMYARADNTGGGSAVLAKTKAILGGRPVPSPSSRQFVSDK